VSDERGRLLVAGTFDPTFARNRVVLRLLEGAGYELTVVRRELWGTERHTLVDRPKARLLLRALVVYPALVWSVLRAPRPDALVVLYPGYVDAVLLGAVARLRRIPLIFDTFISLHDTVVGDRALRRPGSAVGRATRLLDRAACRSASLVLVDTPAHGDYFQRLAGLPPDRFRVLWLGAQEDVFRPRPGTQQAERRVLFHGTFVPLQGLETIVRAAKLLEPEGIVVRLVGDGQERARIEALLADLGAGNVELVGLVPREQVAAEIAAASLCLGIFGTTPKAARVVPNKVFECLAVGAPVLTGDTPAIRAAFDGEVAVVPPGDPEALATAIRDLLADPVQRGRLAAAGHDRFRHDYSESALRRLLVGYVEELVGS
jgi:glycosyltransferase involved in cell wall biosynthesis